MQAYKTTILSTRPVDSFLVNKAREKNIGIDELSFIETEPVQSIEIQQEIELAAIEYATVVFTSMNAVESVISMLNGQMPEWRIYCMGHRTKQLVKEYFGTDAIEGEANSASELADTIIENDDTDEVIFFCGNQRRNELPDKLRNNDITVNEIIVYETTATPQKTGKQYDAVLFFSPSAVESFFSINTLAENCIVFAIGDTTKKTVRKFCKNEIIISDEPGKDKLVEQAISYFSE